MKNNICKICGRISKQRLKLGMCNKHYKQFNKYGKTLDTNPRNNKDPNEIIINTENQYAEIVLYNLNAEEINRTLIDIEDIEIISQYKWQLNNYGYVTAYISTINNKTTRMLLHRMLLNPDETQEIDHKDGNPLNNRKSNLRICNRSENNMNRRGYNPNRVTGVIWNKRSKKWQARIKINNKLINLGMYENIDEAIVARLTKEKEVFGEFSRQKDLMKKYNI